MITWLFNHTRASTLSAVLFHFSVNFTGEFSALSLRGEAFLLAGYCLAAVLLVWRYSPRWLGLAPRQVAA